ncbi:hypothetical protein V8E36_008815 [Tilletia maclaganii]
MLVCFPLSTNCQARAARSLHSPLASFIQYSSTSIRHRVNMILHGQAELKIPEKPSGSNTSTGLDLRAKHGTDGAGHPFRVETSGAHPFAPRARVSIAQFSALGFGRTGEHAWTFSTFRSSIEANSRGVPSSINGLWTIPFTISGVEEAQIAVVDTGARRLVGLYELVKNVITAAGMVVMERNGHVHGVYSASERPPQVSTTIAGLKVVMSAESLAYQKHGEVIVAGIVGKREMDGRQPARQLLAGGVRPGSGPTHVWDR